MPGYNSAEAAQLTREAHGGQHEAANGRDFNMEKIFRAVIVNVSTYLLYTAARYGARGSNSAE